MNRTRALFAALLTVVLVAVPITGATAAKEPSMKDKRQLTVMTQNLYLGSSLTPAITATTPQQFVAAVATIYGTAVATNFPKRAEAIADTIDAERPDLIGLQEVTRWIAQPTVAGAAPPSFDFLAILQAELAERGLDYTRRRRLAERRHRPRPAGLPARLRLPTTLGACFVTLQDRDVDPRQRATPPPSTSPALLPATTSRRRC